MRKSTSPALSFNKLLGLFLLFIAGLIIFRMLYSGTIHYMFMGWNIFLAWIPFVISGQFQNYRKKQKWKQFVLLASWLLFFPNALYIVTDLVHLQFESNMPWWYDLTIIFTSAFVGLLMAFVSLRNAEMMLRRLLTPKMVTLCTSSFLFLGAFGVYLGRFQRWNSWDVVSDPVALSYQLLSLAVNPLDNYRVWAITILFFALYSMLYYTLIKLPPILVTTYNKTAGN
jgi:uncharacterized membrane protein